MIQHLLALITIKMWSATGILLLKHGVGSGKSISVHAAKNKLFYRLFGLVEIIVGVLFLYFMIGWFIPEFGLGFGFELTTYLTVFGLMVVAIVPERKGIEHAIHRYSAYGFAFGLMVMSFFLLATPSIDSGIKALIAFPVAYMLSVWVLVIPVFTKYFQENMLRFQVPYLLAAQTSLLLTTYLG